MNLETRLRSTAMRALCSTGFQHCLRARARLARSLLGRPRTVHYFHQVDDPYSHLAVQKLDQLRESYSVPFVPHLASKPAAAYQGSSEHFDQWALRDALSIAPAYGTHFPGDPQAPAPSAVAAANNRLAAHLSRPDFAQLACATGNALWTGRLDGGDVGAGTAAEMLSEGNALRKALGHYLGGMFYFEGEWYWGLDRLRLLEARLTEEGLRRPGAGLCVPEPTPADTAGRNAGSIQLEYFPSLRSPYTAIGHHRVLDLIRRSGVTVQLKPVMPMLMRGVEAPQAKQRYIITDAGREARARGIAFGRIVDPFGEPVRRAFALFPGAVALNRGMEFVSAYLDAAWAEGIDISGDEGLRQVAHRAGIDWLQLQAAAAGTDWETMLSGNLADMLDAGLWGVPSFRVTGGSIDAPFACWGQDRIWRVEDEIARRA